MAGDWIKMRSNLWDDPRVSRLVDVTDSSEAAIVGSLYWLWSSADQHSEDGVMPGLSLRQIDRKVGIPGFGEALCAIGWLSDNADGVRLSRFDEHNGASAKRRSTDAQRKATVRKVSAAEADKQKTDGGRDADEIRRLAELEKEKEKEKEKKKKKPPTEGAEAPDPIFGDGLSFLTGKGVPERGARSFLGALRRDVGDLVCCELIAAAEKQDVSEPLGWLRKSAVKRKAQCGTSSELPDFMQGAL